MDFVLGPIAIVFGKLLFFIYNSVGFHSYALSLLLFTIAVKLLLLPLSIKQIKSSQRMQEIQPELARIQERYKNDKEKLNEETMKLYQEKKYNPASGCLPLIVQMPILFALFYVIRMPMTYMLDVPKFATGDLIVYAVEAEEPAFIKSVETFEKAKKITFESIKDERINVYNNFRQTDPYIEIKIVEYIDNHPEALRHVMDTAAEKRAAARLLLEGDPAAIASFEKEEQENYLENVYLKHTSRLDGFNIKMWNFFNFGVQPALDLNTIKSEPGRQLPALLLLIIAVVTTFISSKLMMPKPDPKQQKNAQAGCASNSMLWMSPVMTLWFGLTTPSGLAFYWTISNVLSLAQQKLLTRHQKQSAATPAVIDGNYKVLDGKATSGQARVEGKTSKKEEVAARDKKRKNGSKNRR
jgi:YidC/Oxa1 family membrane protein insertase